MEDEFCPECGAKITGNTGFCSECGAVTTSLENKIKEAERIEREEKEKKAKHKKEVLEKRINFVKKNKFYIIGFLILVIVIAVVANFIISSDTSNHVYSCDEFTVEYPHNYSEYKYGLSEYFRAANAEIEGAGFGTEKNELIHIFHFKSNGMSLKEYLKLTKKDLDDFSSPHWYYDILSVDKVKICGVDGYNIKERDNNNKNSPSGEECYIFIKNGECYWISFSFNVKQNDKDIVMNSFKIN